MTAEILADAWNAAELGDVDDVGKVAADLMGLAASAPRHSQVDWVPSQWQADLLAGVAEKAANRERRQQRLDLIRLVGAMEAQA